MKGTTKFSFATILLLLTSASTFAQKADFLGTWTFKDQQSISGKLYQNGSPKQVTITQDSSGLQIASVTSFGGPDTTQIEMFTSGTNGFTTKTAMGRKKVITVTRAADKNSFIETANVYDLADPGKLAFKNTDIWAIINGRLILDRKNENYTNGETWESKATYEKKQ